MNKLAKNVVTCVALTFAALRGGADTNITENLTLDDDLDLREYGAVTIAADATVDLNGHKLTVKGLSCAGNIVNSDVSGDDASCGSLVVDVSDGAVYAVSGLCDVRVEILDGSILSADGDLRCFGKNLEIDGEVALHDHRLRVASIGGTGVVKGGGCRYYRFKVDAVRKDRESVQIGEFKLFSGDDDMSREYAKLTWGSTSDWTNYRPDKALDGNMATKWYDDCAMEDRWFVLEYAVPVAITRYAWYTGDDTQKWEGRNPKSWRLQASNDGANWTDLDVVRDNTSVTTENGKLAYEKVLMIVPNLNDILEVDVSGDNDSYRYYMFKVDAVRRDRDAVQIGEFKLFSGDDDMSREYAKLTWGSTSKWEDNRPDKALDGKMATKWYDDCAMEDRWFVLEYAVPVAITRYAWYTGDDTKTREGRNPKSWRLLGSNDKVTWQDIDVVENNTAVTTDNNALAYEKKIDGEGRGGVGAVGWCRHVVQERCGHDACP